MDHADRERISEAFAGLTALLEDTLVLAVEGQSTSQSWHHIRARVDQLRPMLHTSIDKLARIESQIEDCGND